MIKTERFWSAYKISFNVSSLFTMVSLDYTIDVTFKQIYDDKEIKTRIGRKDIKNLWLLSTKNVNFIFGSNIFLQKDDVAMEYSVCTVLAEIFMVHLKKILTSETREIYEILEKIFRWHHCLC